jgi:hypothetical protein
MFGYIYPDGDFLYTYILKVWLVEMDACNLVVTAL